jgi:serine/threonine-protein kinase
MTSFDPRRWRRMQPLLDQVLDLPPERRKAWLEEACGDAALRGDIEMLLRADAEAGGILDRGNDAAIEELLRTLDASQTAIVEGDPTAANDLERALRRLMQPGRADEPLDGLFPGTVLANRYRIVNLLGRGGMGRVYRADDLKLSQPVALKFLPTRLEREPAALRRLLDEVKLARQISHPNVCRVYDVAEVDGRHFLSMEYVDGEDLSSLIARIGRLPREKSLAIARQLCAGLAAAHDAGILHRDLKPGNVMLDGRGRVRITDFGLAVAAEHLQGEESQAGTPAYMAPEQLEGVEATARSDLYALGLVLYELFTGKRAFPGATLEEARRLRQESTPTRPSALVEGIDAGTERIILRCLESDPELRPPSAQALAAAFPGGDPLATAIAAGDTPSPELVAAAGPQGALSPAVAFSVLGATLLILLVLTMLADRTSVLGWVPWSRSADSLEDGAREMLARLGHGGEPHDRARMIWFTNLDYVRYVEANDRSPQRWASLREPGQQVGQFFYRQSSQLLVPMGRNGRVTNVDPPLSAGEAVVQTDLLGRLVSLQIAPQEAEPPGRNASPDWERLLREAGLDPARLQEAAPTRNPPVFADTRAAWSGEVANFGGYPFRVEAAALRGRPVFFELVFPWSSNWNPSAPRPATRFRTPLVFILPLVLAAIAGVVGGVRNWLSGRGDRRGAFRLAATVLFLRFAVWIFGGHHVPAPAQEWLLLVIALSKSLTDAAVAWCLYLAVEPYARRLYPHFLVSWTRLLRGRFGDPLVGRDVLAGTALGTIFLLCYLNLHVLIPHSLGLASPPPPLFQPSGNFPYIYFLDPPFALTSLGGRHVLEGLAARMLGALGDVMLAAVLLLGLRLVLRRDLLALVALAVIFIGAAWPTTQSGFRPIGIACSVLAAAVFLFSLRFGLVGLLSVLVCFSFWSNFPVTAKFDAPHFGIGLIAVLAIAGMATYGAITASRRRGVAGAREARLAA